MKSINVEGRIALVDDEDFDQIRRHRWRLHPQGYAFRKTSRSKKTVTLLMHRVVMNAPQEMEVDHLHGLKLDNRKSELALIKPKAHRKKHASTLAAWQKAHQIYPNQKPCAVCGAVFAVNPRKRKRHKCCSQACAQILRGRGRTAQAQLCRKSRKHLSKQP